MMMDLLLYIPLFLALYIITKFFIHKLRNLPPTPFLCLSIIGHIYFLKKPLHRTLANLSEAYGPAFYLSLGFHSVLVVSSQSAAKDCLRQNNDIFPDNPQGLVTKFIGRKNAKLLSALPYGQQWRTLRRILTSDLVYSGCLHHFSTASREEVKSLIRRLYKQSSDDGLVVEMKGVFYELTYRVIGRVIAGEEWCNGENGKKFGKVLEELVKDLIDEHKSSKCDEYGDSMEMRNNKTMIQSMLSLQLKDPVHYSDEIIKGLIIVLLIAGTDTCSTTMEWALSLLLNNPSVLAKAQAEIDENVGQGRLVDEQDRLPYLDCIIKETLRMYPAGPLLVPHETHRSCVVEGGYRVPKGTLLLINMWAIHNSPKTWFEPHKFKPERFEEGIDKSKVEGYKFMDLWSKTSRSTADIMPVRMGALILGSLIQCFDCEINGEGVVDMEEGALLTTTKATPLEARLRPRPTVLELVS